MITATYTLVRTKPSLAVVVDPSHKGKVKSYTKPQFARSARAQSDFVRGDGWAYRIMETIIYADGGVITNWLD